MKKFILKIRLIYLIKTFKCKKRTQNLCKLFSSSLNLHVTDSQKQVHAQNIIEPPNQMCNDSKLTISDNSEVFSFEDIPFSTIPNSCWFLTHHSSLPSFEWHCEYVILLAIYVCARMFTNAFKIIYILTGRASLLLFFPLFCSHHRRRRRRRLRTSCLISFRCAFLRDLLLWCCV